MPPFDFGRLLSEWELAPFPLIATVWVSGLYLLGVRALRRRGDAWPIGRTIMFVTAMAMLVFVTSSGLAVYEKYLFSVHMLGHMVLSMGIPVLIVLAAPVTLAARAADLALALWERADPLAADGRFTIEGDPEVVRALATAPIHP